MRNFLIGGTIVDTDEERYTIEDVTPNQVRSVLRQLKDKEPITFEIASCGGSCTGGLAIANLIKKCSSEGHETIAHVVGLAASMASVIACACDRVQMDESSFMMIHNPWTIAEGDSEALRKEADTLDKFKSALLSFYRSKFSTTDEEILRMMDEETWIVGSQAEIFSLRAEVIPNKEPLRACAYAKSIPQFNNTPKIENLFRMGTHMEEKENVENTEPQVQPNEPEAKEPQEEMIAKAEADKRVSGMQATMAKQIDSLRKEHEAQIADFNSQLKARDEELIKCKAEVTNLTSKLDNVSGELLEKASALEAKEKALATLNGNVNTPQAELPTMEEGLAKCLTPSEKVAFLKSGNYKH